MTIWHVLGLILAVIGYQSGSKIVKDKYHNDGLRVSGFFQNPDRYYREGSDAVAFGRIRIMFSALLAFTVITEILGLHNYALQLFVIMVIVLNILVGLIYPAKREISVSERKIESRDESQEGN